MFDVAKRRTILAAGFCLLQPARLLAQSTTFRRPLAFEVWRKGHQIGTHTVSFRGDSKDFAVATDAELLVKIGPVPVFRYHHQASEFWRAGRFVQLESHTTTNGSEVHVTAVRSADSVTVSTSKGQVLHAPPGACPLTHWNAAVLGGPVINPQNGELPHERVTRTLGDVVQLADGRKIPATRCTLTGDADLTDWYDGEGVWTALQAKAPDGSLIDYRRTV
ncbi:DUF6134 family protein [Caulobacter sp. S45]|uniref:DUF6134 family protein n=1 Tax=Caulobacter sp. S45 TaxID=1641861 RepID=UPI0015764892|nr:DUF6134 family protein [Caulobacter sp. S45]